MSRRPSPFAKRINPVHHVVVDGKTIELGARQYQILLMAGVGMNAAEIGRRLHLGTQDIHNRLRQISMRKGIERERLVACGQELAQGMDGKRSA